MSTLKLLLGTTYFCVIASTTWAKASSDEATRFFETHPNKIDFREVGESLLFANRLVGLELRRSNTGFHLVRLYGIAENRDFLTEDKSGKPRDIFELRMSLDPKHVGKNDRFNIKGSLMGIMDEMAKDAFSIGSHAAKSVSWRWEGDDDESVLYLDWKQIDVKEDNAVMDVAVTVMLRADDPLSYWRIGVRNRGRRYGIERVRFPLLNLAPIGEPEDNVLIVPRSRGRLIENPFKQRKIQGYYTCEFEMQFQALYDSQRRNGIYLATQQSDPCLTQLQISCLPSEIAWQVSHFPPNITFADEDFTITYDTVAGPFQGDWFDACQIYRKWAIKQFWCEKGPLSRRDDIPKWYKEAPLYFYTTFNDSAQGTHSMDENLQIAADHFREWLDWAGMRLPVNWYAWEQPVHGLSVRDIPGHIARSGLKKSAGRWSGMTGHNYYDGNYPGIKTLREFSTVAGQLREEGGMVCPYIALELFNQGPAENAPYTAQAKPHAIRDLFGCIRSWGGDISWQMCSWPQWWRNRLKETCELMLDHENIGGVYLDVMRGSCLPCYWPAHGHSAAGGNSMTTGRYELVKIIRDAIRAKDNEAIMTGENPSENMIGLIDGMLTFTLSAETKAPLFATVYQDYIPRYGLELSTGKGWQGRFPEYRPEGFFIECASLFCEGSQIGRIRLRPRDAILSFQNPEDKEEIDFLGRLVGYYRQDRAKKFLVYGQLMRPLDFAAPSPMPTQTYTAMYEPNESQFPVLMSGVFRADDGSLGVFVVNAGEKEVRFKAEMELSRYELPANAIVDVAAVTPNGTSKEVLRNVKNVVPLTGSLPGHDVTMFWIKPTH